MAILKVLVSFNYSDGRAPNSLFLNNLGDLFGTTGAGGANDSGTMFEIPNTAGSYASEPVTLITFGLPTSALPLASTTDAAGNLFGSTLEGGPGFDGTVFEVRYINGSYDSTATTLASFNGVNGDAPSAVTLDTAGNLFGTTNVGGANDDGTVFEIAKTLTGYANTPTTLVSFSGNDGYKPLAAPVIDASGDLFGTTVYGGTYGNGTVYEIPYIDGRYATTPITLVSFQGTNSLPGPNQLMTDAAGDLIGTTEIGGADNLGMVFEIPKTAGGYGSLTILASFDGVNGNLPYGGLIADTAGDLFGTTASGGANNDGTVFEIARTATGYATTPETVFSFDGADGRRPLSTLIADATGNLFGSTDIGGPSDAGTVFELTDTGFVICFARGTQIATPAGEVPVEQLFVGDMVLTATGQAQPIVWMGIGRVLVTPGRRSAATPVIVRRSALADNVPHRDVRVTKGHSLFIDDVLIPVEFLVNHRSIIWDDRAREIDIYHVELAKHGVLIADGALAESYRDDGNRWLFQNGNSGWGLPPQLPCAPVLTGGPIVDTIWRRLLDRAGPRPGLPTTADPDLHLLVDGQRVDGKALHSGLHLFHLSQHPASVHIVSRATAPQELGRARDPRCLGVAVRRIVVREDSKFRVTEAADTSLVGGFHQFEANNGCRWTDGDAVVPAELFAGFTGAMEIMLAVTGSTHYIDTGDRRQVA